MAAFCSRLIRCLATSRHMYSRQTMLNTCSIQPYLVKSQALRLLEVSSRNCPISLFCSHSQETSEHSIGHLKKQAEIGFKTGGDNYDAHRPSYTDESVDLIVSQIVSATKATPVAGVKYDVLELGAGTGKLTEQLSKKLPGHMKYLASEPSENFLGVLKEKGLNVETTIATADSIPLEDKSVANIVCAQCFHWFSEKENLASIRRVLVPEGKLILIWNMKKFDFQWMTAFYEQRKEVVTKVDGSMKYIVNSMDWRKDIDVSHDFKLLWHKSLLGVNFQGNVEEVLANLTTVSAYNALPVAERDVYVDELRQVLRNWPGLDLNNITLPYSTELYVYVAQ